MVANLWIPTPIIQNWQYFWFCCPFKVMYKNVCFETLRILLIKVCIDRKLADYYVVKILYSGTICLSYVVSFLYLHITIILLWCPLKGTIDIFNLDHPKNMQENFNYLIVFLIHILFLFFYNRSLWMKFFGWKEKYFGN